MADDHFVMLPLQLLGCRELNATQKIVYAYLRYRQGDNASAYPSLERIADDLALSKPTVCEAYRALCRAGLLTVAKGSRGRGAKHVNHYTIVPFVEWLQRSDSLPFSNEKRSDFEPFTQPEKVKNPNGKGKKSERKRSDSLPEENHRREKGKDTVVPDGYPTGPDHHDDDDVFGQIIETFNSCQGKQHTCFTPALRQAARQAYDRCVAEFVTPTEMCRGYSHEDAAEFIRQVVENYAEAWAVYPSADRDCGLTTLLGKPSIRRTYEPGYYSLEAIRSSATRPDRPREPAMTGGTH